MNEWTMKATFRILLVILMEMNEGETFFGVCQRSNEHFFGLETMVSKITDSPSQFCPGHPQPTTWARLTFLKQEKVEVNLNNTYCCCRVLKLHSLYIYQSTLGND